MSKKIITKKQQTIITLILSFRFINSKQIQQFLQHKDHRRINTWLKDLEQKNYIVREFKPRFGALTKPTVCYLTVLGRKYIRNTFKNTDEKYLARLRDDKKRSKSFKVRCQVIADCFLIIFSNKVSEFVKDLEVRLKEGITLHYNEFQFFNPAFYHDLDFILLPQLKPDAYVYIRRRQGITHTCIYVLDAYIPRLMLQYTLKHIFTVLNEEDWEDDSISSLQIYFICPNNMVIIYLRRLLSSFLERYYGSNTLIFHFATRNQLYKRQKEHSEKIGWITVSTDDE